MFKNEVAAMISNVLNMPQENILPLILENEDLKRGDYSIACFSFAKQLKFSPDNIAKKISDNVKLSNNFVSVSSIGGYVNFFVNKGSRLPRPEQWQGLLSVLP